MPNQNAHKFERIISKYKQLMRVAPDQVGIIALKLFKEDTFSRQGQIMGNGTVKKWPSRGASPQNRNNATLLIKSGQLRRDLNYRKSGKRVILKSDLPYSKLQNDGGAVPVTSKMRKFFWAMYKKTGDEFWKGMALTKKTSITIRPRPFLYDTPELPKRLDNHFIPLIKQIIQQS
jgi:phage gpG-like protein